MRATEAADFVRPGKSCFVCCMNQERQVRGKGGGGLFDRHTTGARDFDVREEQRSGERRDRGEEEMNAVVGRGGEVENLRCCVCMSEVWLQLAAEVNTRELSLEELTSGIEGDYR
eukprot:749607-Hanusia_phi.AAC.1